MIAPKLAKLLIWKIRQGIAVYQSENKRKRGYAAMRRQTDSAINDDGP